MEIWKDIEGYEGQYQISNLGNVRSLDRKVMCGNNSYREIKGCNLVLRKNNKTGYIQIKLLKKCKHKVFSVHRLVAKAFLPNPYNLPEVNHINEIKTDNRAENLEWCDRKYNLEYSNICIKGAYSQRRKVVQLTLNGEFVAEYDSISDAGRKTGVPRETIGKCCRGNKYKSTGGYKWQYK